MLSMAPYVMTDATLAGILKDIAVLGERVYLLRSQSKLAPETISAYYKRTRFLQIAESNALEGSTLTAGETEEAVLKGITISGHDEGWSRDAKSLAAALERLAEIARQEKATDILELKELHQLIFGERAGGGMFRTTDVRIRGSAHKPPATIKQVLDQMEQWERWSQDQAQAPPVFRAAVLHAWLTHIHPFIDGNGRTARAVTNLELIRHGYPPLIIRKTKDRDRYLEALRASDDGDLAPFAELIVDRAGDALRDLERTAQAQEGYDAGVTRVRLIQASNLAVWLAGVELLSQMLVQNLQPIVATVGGTVTLEPFRESLSLDDYLELCMHHPVSRSWLFKLKIEIPGLKASETLAWAGYRSKPMDQALPAATTQSPSIFWSRRNLGAYPPWKQLSGIQAPGGEELGLLGERWWLRRGQSVEALSTTDAATRIARDLFAGLN